MFKKTANPKFCFKKRQVYNNCFKLRSRTIRKNLWHQKPLPYTLISKKSPRRSKTKLMKLKEETEKWEIWAHLRFETHYYALKNSVISILDGQIDSRWCSVDQKTGLQATKIWQKTAKNN